MSKGETVPEEIAYRLKIWLWVSSFLRYVHISIGIIAIVSSVTVAARLLNVSGESMSWVAWLAAISSALLTSMNLETKSNHIRKAWRHLNTAILRFENEEHFPIEKLVDAYQEGETMVGDVEIKLK